MLVKYIQWQLTAATALVRGLYEIYPAIISGSFANLQNTFAALYCVVGSI